MRMFMDLYSWSYLCGLLIILLHFNDRIIADDRLNSCSNLKWIMNGLSRSLIVYHKYYRKFNYDGYFGFQMAQEFLSTTSCRNITRKCSNQQLLSKCLSIAHKLQRLNSLAQSSVKLNHRKYYKQIFDVSDSLLQIIRDKKHPTRSLHSITNQPIEFTNKPRPDSSSEDPNYNEELGDDCMSTLFRSNCSVSNRCLNAFSHVQQAKKYKATHNVIFWSIYQQKGCYGNPLQALVTKKQLSDLLNDICLSILNENLGNIRNSQRRAYSIDLFLERIALCGGILGYRDFYSSKSIEVVQESQGPGGCFSSYNYIYNLSKKNQNGLIRKKRVSTYLREHCDDHTLGLGAATLASFLFILFG